MAPMTSMMAMPDFGLKTDDVHYLRMETQIQGRGPNRLKYLDLEGRWFLSGKSIPYISQTFNHLNTLNSARVPMRDLNEEPLNAIGMVSWTKSSEPAPVEKKPSPPKLMRPPVFIEDEVPQSPREVVPHRSAGYGQAHQKRKLSVPDRSRSASPLRNDTTTPDFDKYAKFERNRKDSITRYGTRWGDAGYGSSSPSPTDNVIPKNTSTLTVKTQNEKGANMPYRTHGYGAYHEKRHYDISPRSMGSTDYSSGSEQGSPNSYERSADEVVLLAYHSRGQMPRVNRQWIQ